MKDYTKPDQWDLYRMCFEEGQEVVLIGEDDQVWAGSLKTTPEAAILRHGRGTKNTVVPWIQCRFMCHDGFPYKKLRGKFTDKFLVEKLEKANAARVVRHVLHEHGISEEVPMVVRHAIFGDPFETTQPVVARLHNSGNIGPYWYCQDLEECVILTAPDGAKAQLFDLATVLHWEAA